MAAAGATRFEAMEQLLRALADPTRLRIVGLLLAGEVCVCHIHETLRIPQPKASRHLAYLKRARLVADRRNGLWVYYRLVEPADAVLRAIVDTIAHCCAAHVPIAERDRRRLERATGRCCTLRDRPAARPCCSGATGERL